MLEHANRKFLPPSLWTDERIELLKKLWARGYSASQVAYEIGGFAHCHDGGRSAVIGKIHRLKMPARKTTIPLATKARGDIDRSVTQRIARSVKLRRPSNGGPVIVKSVIRDELPMAADFLGVTFDNLEARHCRFPRGEGRDIRFCGQPRAVMQPYCLNCCKIAYNAPPQRRVIPFLTGNARTKPAVY